MGVALLALTGLWRIVRRTATVAVCVVPLMGLGLLSINPNRVDVRPVPPAAAWTRVTATELIDAYRADPGAAHRELGNRPLEITGRIVRVPRPLAQHANPGHYFDIALRHEQRSAWTAWVSCRAEVDPQAAAWASTVATGDVVTVRGYTEQTMRLGGIVALAACTPLPPA